MATRTFTVGDEAGSDYVNLAATASAEFNGVNFGGDDIVLIIQGTSAESGTEPQFLSATNCAKLTIRAQTGQENLGQTGRSGACKVTFAQNIRLAVTSVCPVEIRDIEFDGLGNILSRGMISDELGAAGGDYLIERCVFHNTSSGAGNEWRNRGIEPHLASTWRIYQNVFHSMGGSGIGNRQTDTRTLTIDGNTIYNCNQSNDPDSGGIDFYQVTAASTITGRNNIAMNNGGVDYRLTGLYDTADRNMSSDGTAPGTTNYPNETATSIFVAPGTNDFNLQAGTNAINNGLTLVHLNPDIAGVTRPQGAAYDLGALERVSAGPTYSPFWDRSRMKPVIKG